MQIMDAATKVTKARTALVLDHFFFGSLALRLKVVEDATCETAWTDGVSFGYNPKFIDSLNMDETKGLWCHEVMHLSLAHHARRQGRDSETWNIACDFAVDPIIKAAGMKLPPGEHVSDQYKDASADHIFADLNRKKKEQQGNDSQQQQSGNQQQQTQKQQSQSNGNPQQSGKQGQNAQGHQSQQQQPNGFGEVRDYPGQDPQQGATESEMEQQAQEWQVAATQAATQAKARGNLPGNLERLIEKLNEPKVNWKEALRRFVDQVARNDYTFRRVNQRYTHRGIILPSLYNEELPPIDLAIDTSGSVDDEQLAQFASEMDDILTQYNTTLRVIYCDTAVRHTEEFTQDNRPVKLNAKGGGGTKFSPAIRHAMQQDERPVCFIYLTDLYCNDFGPEPDFPVLWCQTVETYGKKEVPFGELIKCIID